MKKIKFGIRGAYGEQNFGDDALQFFLYKWAKKNNLNPVFIGIRASYIKKLIPGIEYIDKLNLYQYFFEKLVLGGGTQFFSFKTIQKQPSKIRVLFTNPLLFFKKAFRFISKKYFYPTKNYKELHALGIGFGPFISNSSVEKQAMLEVSQMKSVFPRDFYSYEFAKKYNKNTFKGTDICFLPDIIDYSKYKNSNTDIKKIAIIVRDWNYKNGGEHYLDKILEQLDDLKEYEIDFIFFKNEPVSEKKLNNYNRIKWNPETQSIPDFLEILSAYDLFISARFHGVIFGALLNIPSIAVEIEPKLNLTSEFLGEGVKIWKQPFDKSLKVITDNLSVKKMKEELEKNVSVQNSLAQNMFSEFKNFLNA